MSDSSKRIPQLDGLRGIAILLVFSSHLIKGLGPHHEPLIPGTDWEINGGFIGVTLFFVLSGFLITSIILRERESSGRIDLGQFYIRRARRLLPALVAVCAVYGVYAIVALRGQDLLAAAGSIGKAITYTTNLHPILPTFPDSKWLRHTWSLGIEEQFYILWPITLYLVYGTWGRRGVLVAALGGIAVTILAREVLDLVRPSHSIYSYLLRWDSLLIGCALAVRPLRPHRAFVWMAWAYLGYTSIVRREPPPTWEYATSSIACATILMSSFEQKWLCNRVLVWFGTISYGLYLWHVFIMRFGLPGWANLVVSLLVAQISYTFIERRFLRRSHNTVQVPTPPTPVPSPASP